MGRSTTRGAKFTLLVHGTGIFVDLDVATREASLEGFFGWILERDDEHLGGA